MRWMLTDKDSFNGFNVGRSYGDQDVDLWNYSITHVFCCWSGIVSEGAQKAV